MKRAGHSSFKTTQGYIDLAGELFRPEVNRLEERLYGPSKVTFLEACSTRSGTNEQIRSLSRQLRHSI
jgi:hypothetical protein